MCKEKMVLPENEKKDKNIFKQIISENWEDFKKKYPSYNKPHYEELLMDFLEHADKIGALERITMIEEPFPEEMLGEVDAAVVVFRRGDLHYEYALPFIRTGIATWVDKPFTVKVSEARILVKEAEKYGTKLVGGSVVPALSAIQSIKKSIQDGTVGKIQTGSVSYAFKLVNDYGGMVFYSPHVVESAMTIFGYDVKSVISSLTNNVLTAIAKYEDFQITMNFIDFNKSIYITAIGDKGEIIKKIQGGVKLEGVKGFIEIIEGRREPQKSYELINPVAFLTAMEQSLDTGKEIYLQGVD